MTFFRAAKTSLITEVVGSDEVENGWLGTTRILAPGSGILGSEMCVWLSSSQMASSWSWD
jgi:hypothetical protein